MTSELGPWEAKHQSWPLLLVEVWMKQKDKQGWMKQGILMEPNQ